MRDEGVQLVDRVFILVATAGQTNAHAEGHVPGIFKCRMCDKSVSTGDETSFQKMPAAGVFV